ncbi:MAG: Omp28-related outer membrane protein [Saprospiraceae bacterium]
MRILLLLLALSSLSLFAQQTVPEVQKPMVTKVTATWCPPCGGWGWDLFEDLIEDNETSAVLIAGHYAGSDLETTAGNEIADNFGVSGQPSFYLGNTRQSATSGSAATSRTNIKNAIDAQVASAPVANATVWSTAIQGREFSFETKTQFFQAASGEYNLAVYAVEDDVINRQTSRGNDAVHHRVMRGTILGQSSFGELVVNGSASVDAIYTSSFSFDFPATWMMDEVRLVTVLWKKNGAGGFDFVNANEIMSNDWQQIVSGTNNVLAANDFRITGFSESGILYTSLDLTTETQGVSVELIDVNGRVLARRQLGTAPSGKTQLIWDDVRLPVGLVVVRLRTSEGERSAKVVLR